MKLDRRWGPVRRRSGSACFGPGSGLVGKSPRERRGRSRCARIMQDLKIRSPYARLSPLALLDCFLHARLDGWIGAKALTSIRRSRAAAKRRSSSSFSGGSSWFPMRTRSCWKSALNVPEAKYPCVYPDHRAMFRVIAPNAQKVSVRIGQGLGATLEPKIC